MIITRVVLVLILAMMLLLLISVAYGFYSVGGWLPLGFTLVVTLLCIGLMIEAIVGEL